MHGFRFDDRHISVGIRLGFRSVGMYFCTRQHRMNVTVQLVVTVQVGVNFDAGYRVTCRFHTLERKKRYELFMNELFFWSTSFQS
jgi:hypothetical protein